MSRTNYSASRHPDHAVLQSFAAGLIESEPVALAVEEHVSDCIACAQFLVGLEPDETEKQVARWAASVDWPGGEESHRYELIGEIGRGGTGIVYKARQAGLERLLAWKVLISGARASPAELARFRREAQALARLDHPQIVQVHDFGEQEGSPFLAMELVDGPSLAKRLERGPVEPRLVAAWIRDLARAIDYAHQRSIFHRDLKPQNVLLARNGSAADDLQFIPKIVDFGLARFENDSLFQTKTGETLGTPAYLAPEMIGTRQGAEGSAAVDVYGLGTILYECLTGRPPFIGSSHLEILTAVSQREPVPVRLLRQSVPRDLAVICHRCLAKTPSRRFSTAAELAGDLDRFLNGLPITSRPVTRVERTIRWCRRNPWKAVAGSLLLLVLLAIPAAGVYHNALLRREKATAQARYESTRETLWQMLNLLKQDQTAAIPQMAELSAKQTEQALALFDELAAADPTERSRLDLAKAEILAGTLATVLGNSDQAESHLQHAVNICRELQHDSQIADEALEQLAAALNKLGVSMNRASDQSQVIGWLEQALEIHRELASRDPDNFLRRSGVAWSLMNLGSSLQIQGQPDRAIPLYEEAIQIRDSMVEAGFNVDESRQSAAGTRINLASICLEQGDSDSAGKIFRRALDDLETLHKSSPDNKSVVEDLTSCLLNYSNCLAENGLLDDAVAACTRARELLLEALKHEPGRALLKQNLFLVTANRANLLVALENHSRAAAEWHDAVELAPDPGMKTYCRHLRLCSLARSGQTVQATNEIKTIDESALAPDEKFLQAICWALIARSYFEKHPGQIETPETGSAQAAAARAWQLLMELARDGHLTDPDRREHLQTSVDWDAIRRVRTPEEWNGLTPKTTVGDSG